MFDFGNEKDDVLDTADNDDGDDAKKKSINNWKTRSKQWKMMETIQTPMKLRLWMDLVFFKTLTLTYHSFFLSQSSFVGWMCLSLSWYTQQVIIGNEDV